MKRRGQFNEHAHLYAKAVRDKGGALENCVGFMDGTKIKMCRPGGERANQRANYSGHKRFHGLTYQTGTVPDDLIINIRNMDRRQMAGPQEAGKLARIAPVGLLFLAGS